MVEVAGPPPRTETVKSPPSIDSEFDVEYRDLVFMADSEVIQRGGRKVRVVRARGTYEGKPVGFEFVWGANSEWRPVTEKPLPRPIYFDKGLFVSIGAHSDAFVSALFESYHLKPVETRMGKVVAVTMAVLEGDPRKPEAGLVKIKLFFNENSEKYYGELFLHLDLQHNRLVLAEKDVEYRSAVAQSLTGAKDKA